MIGETPAPATTTTTEAPKPPSQTGNSHVVAKGETLTSIAKMHKVSVEELQRFNHIENDRKLQIGQTIMIPPSAEFSRSFVLGVPDKRMMESAAAPDWWAVAPGVSDRSLNHSPFGGPSKVRTDGMREGETARSNP